MLDPDIPSGGLSEHKLSWFIRLVGVRAAIYRIYYSAKKQRASLERVFWH